MISLFVFTCFCALRQWRRGQHCIDCNTTSAVLSVPGCNLCRAEVWGEESLSLTRTKSTEQTFNGLNTSQLSVSLRCLHKPPIATHFIQTSRHLTSPDRRDPMPDDSSPLTRASSQSSRKPSISMPDQSLTPQPPKKDSRHCAPLSHPPGDAPEDITSIMRSSHITHDAQATGDGQLKKAAPDQTYCVKLNHRRSQVKPKDHRSLLMMLTHIFALSAVGFFEWIAQRSSLTWAPVLMSFSWPAS